jgi:NCAIR mutase (PurE)-related protein
MNQERLKKLIGDVAEGRVAVQEAVKALALLPSEDLEFAHIDHHRSLRKGFPEVIFGEAKAADQITAIMKAMVRQDGVVLVTRINKDKAAAVLTAFPEAVYDAAAQMLILERQPLPNVGRGKILVLSAGTSDIPVAREAYLTAKTMGHSVTAINDVGVAGIHRLFAYKEEIEVATVLVVVAGMEGALPSVVAGMVGRPVIAVPTSVGYGTSFGGLTALLSMLNSCSSNVAVVNIDNGFGGGYMAAMINRK